MSSSSLLRPLEAADLPYVLPLYTDPHTREFLGGPVSSEIATERAAGLLEDGCTWVILAEDGSSAAGIVTLHPHHDGISTEMSYSLLPQHTGRGLATAALQQMLDHAFSAMGLSAVVSETQAANLRSTRLLERLGMQEKERLTRFGAEQIIYTIHANSAQISGDSTGSI